MKQHKIERTSQLWGTYGRNPVRDTPTWVPVAKLANNHIINILATQDHIPGWFRRFLLKEIVYRAGHRITIPDVDHYEGYVTGNTPC